MFENFDIKKYLESRKIEYYLEGRKNVTRGWININCPFPNCDDPSWHCGINLKSKLYNCYICGSKGSPERLVVAIEQCSYRKAIETIDSFPEDPEQASEKKTIRTKKVILPDYEKIFHQKHFKYLSDRNFNAEKIINKYNLKSVYNIGDYKFRIIIPYYYNKEIVTFNTRDITNKSDYKYLFCDEERSIIPIKQTLYNIDTVKDKCIIVEGPSDVWRMGNGTVGTSGKMFTKEQLLMLKRKKVKHYLVLYDSDDVDDYGKSIGKKLANQLSILASKVDLIELDSGDPADLNQREAKEIRSLIF